MNDLKGWQIGDRVVCVETVPTNEGSILKGSTGTIVNINWELCVQWDNFHDGHNNSHTADVYTGNSLWWVFEDAVELDVEIVENE